MPDSLMIRMISHVISLEVLVSQVPIVFLQNVIEVTVRMLSIMQLPGIKLEALSSRLAVIYLSAWCV